MNPLKRLALTTYLNLSAPARRQLAVRRSVTGTEPVSILFYHRVADEHPNEWTMSCRAFERQIEWIRKRFEVVDLAEAQRRVAAGKNHRPTVCLTFDDGYADNCEFAIPLLLRLRLPVTYFVSTEHVLNGLPFPHDVAAGVRLRPNTLEELRSMSAAGIEIGAHTRTHADLGRTDQGYPNNSQRLRDEIVGSQIDLEDALQREIRYFAFPFGLPENMCSEAFRIAYLAGLRGVCSAYGAYNLPGGDPFHLRRIHADPQLVRLKNWLTVDPRKLKRDLFDPGDYQSPHAPDCESALQEVAD